MESKFSNDTIKSEIDTLLEIALKNGKISRNTVIHLLSGKNAIDDYQQVITYMSSKGIQFIDEDIEFTEFSNIEDNISNFQPFDSTQINIAQKTLSIEGLLKRLRHDEIDMNTEFQRKSGLWDNVTKSQLIESLILRIPLPVFYFDGTQDDKWLVIDGLQRLTTFKEFFIDKKLELTGLEYFRDYNNCKYDDLPRTYIRRMEETQLFLYIIQPGTPENVKFNIFKRINTPGLKLEPQEIRHALYQGKATKLLKVISESDIFYDVTSGSISNDRMLACEIVLRYLAFKVIGRERFEELDGQQDRFLNEAMIKLNNMQDIDIDNVEKDYYRTLKRIKNLFGMYSFRKMTSIKNGRKNPFNVALYETWMFNIGVLSDEQYNILLSRKDILLKKYIDLLKNKTFGYDISSGKRIAVLRRIETINKLINEVLNVT